MARILVIDDDSQIQELVQEMLERDGHEAILASDGAEGIALFAAQPADLALVDLFIPGAGGLVIVRAVQELRPGVPIIMISGGPILEVVKPGSPGTVAGLRGLAGYRELRKPFKYAELSAAVRELLPDESRAPSR